MKETIKKTLRRLWLLTGTPLIWLGSIILLMLILIQCALWAGFFWLNTDSGQAWLQAQTNKALAQSGYSLRFDRLRALTFPGIGARQIVIETADGPYITIDRPRLRADLFPLAARHLSVSLRMDGLTLHKTDAPRTPEETPAPDTAGAEALAPFTLPDIYFTTISLDSVRIDRLVIESDAPATPATPDDRGTAETDAPNAAQGIQQDAAQGAEKSVEQNIERNVEQNIEQNIEQSATHNTVPETPPAAPPAARASTILSPALTARLEVRPDSTATLDALLVLHPVDKQPVAPTLPHRLALAATMDTTALRFALQTVDVESALYHIKAHGAASLYGDEQNAALKATVEGAALADKSVAPVTILVTATDILSAPQGRVQAASAYQDIPVTIETAYAYAAPTVTITGLQARAPDLTLDGDVRYDTAAGLADGDIKATLSLARYQDLLTVPVSGAVNVDVSLRGADDKQGAIIRAALDDLRYEALTVRSTRLDVAYDDVSSVWPRTADLDITALTHGEARIDAAQVRIIPVTAQGRTEDDTTDTAQDAAATTPAHFALSLSARGAYQKPFALSGSAKLKGRSADTAAAEDIDLALKLSGSTLTLTGEVQPETLAVTLATDNLTLGHLPVALPEMLAGLQAAGKATVNGPLAAPVADADFSFSPLRVADKAPDIRLHLTAGYADGTAQARLNGTGTGIRTLQADATVPLSLSLKPFTFAMPAPLPLNANVMADADAKALADLMLPPTMRAAGDLKATIKAAGTAAAPAISGDVRFTNGLFAQDEIGVLLTAIDMNATLGADAVRLVSLRASDGQKGTITASGTAGLTGERPLDFTVQADTINLLQNSSMANGTLSADLNLTGRNNAYKMGGTITTDTFEINIPERFASSVPKLNIVEAETGKAAPPPIANDITLDMAIVADNRIFVRGWGLDAEFGGTLEVTGTLNDPQINGTFSSRRGRYEEFGKRFTLAKADLRFQGSVPPSPYLDINAETDAGDIVARVELTGPVADPNIKLSSTPALPEDEVLSRILFGRDMTKISPLQAIQLTQTLQRFTGRGGGGFDPLGQLRAMTGLDDLRVDTEEDGGATVGAGKYLTEKVYLELQTGSTENSGAANIQIEVTPNITVESEIGQDAQAGGGVFWRWDY